MIFCVLCFEVMRDLDCIVYDLVNLIWYHKSNDSHHARRVRKFDVGLSVLVLSLKF